LKNKTSTGVVGLLDQNGFNFTSLVPSNSSTNPLPLKIKIGGYLFGNNLDIIISQVTGLRSKVKSNVWEAAQNISESSTSNLVSFIPKFAKLNNSLFKL
jgi:hypothetical protein